MTPFDLAQAGAPTTQQNPPWWANPFIPIVVLLVFFYLFVTRSKRGEERKRKDMLEALKKGDEIQTIGGVLGKVVETREDRVLVKVDESTNAKVWFSRSAIHRVLGEERVQK